MGWYLTITEEMRAAGLAGNALLCYALVHGYSQMEQGCYYGTIAHTADVMGCSAETARTTLRTLCEDGFIDRFDFLDGGIRRVAYRATQKIWDTQKFGDTQKIGEVPPQNFGTTTQKIGDNISSNNKINNKNNNNISMRTREGKFDFRAGLLALGVTEETADAWLDVRKRAKAVNSELALRDIAAEIEKAAADGWTAEDCIRRAAAKSWRGFEAAWIKPKQPGNPTPNPRPYESAYTHNARVLAAMFGTDPDTQL